MFSGNTIFCRVGGKIADSKKKPPGFAIIFQEGTLFDQLLLG